MKTENGKVNQRSTPEGAEVKTENYPPPPLRSSPLSQGDSWLRGVQENWKGAEESEESE